MVKFYCLTRNQISKAKSKKKKMYYKYQFNSLQENALSISLFHLNRYSETITLEINGLNKIDL
jgi:hypothetical protein